jgi:hypothetical protein
VAYDTDLADRVRAAGAREVGGLLPYSFESTTRTRRPPTLSEAIWRTVWFQKFLGTRTGAKESASHTGCGLAVHVAIQPPASDARAREIGA